MVPNNRKLKFQKFWLAMAVMTMLAAPNCVDAQPVSVEAELSARQVTLDAVIQFTITVNGGNNIDPIAFPPVEGFQVKYLGPSTRVSIINGQQSTSKSFIYALYPLKEGVSQIPAVSIKVDGKVYTLQPVPLEVVKPGMGAPAGPAEQPASLEDKIFAVIKVPKKEVFLNEPLPVKILLFVREMSVRDIQYPDLNNIGFTMKEYDKPQQYQQLVDGLPHNIVEFNTTIFPTRVGTLQLGPANISANIVVQTAGLGPRIGSGGSRFDDEFFNSFFGRQERRPVNLETDAVAVTVLPLPDQGKPPDFSGAVGQYNFNVDVSPKEVRTGDPLTLRMTIIGNGNLSSVQMPSLPLDAGFKLYDPQIFEKDNIKKTEQVIIPQTEEISDVPALKFSFFDPELKQYLTLTRGPFPIVVKKLDQSDEFTVVGLGGEYSPVVPETLGQDIVFIKSRPGRFRVRGERFYNSLFFFIILFMGFLSEGGALLFLRKSQRLKTDIVYARKLLAPREARKGLAEAKTVLSQGNKDVFYDILFKTMQRYLGNKLHLPSGAVTFDTVNAKLPPDIVERKVVEDVRIVFEECDRVRYAPASIDAQAMDESYSRAARCIDYLERHLK